MTSFFETKLTKKAELLCFQKFRDSLIFTKLNNKMQCEKRILYFLRDILHLSFI